MADPTLVPAPVAAEPAQVRRTGRAGSQAAVVLRRFARSRPAMVSLVVLALVVLAAFVGPALWRYDHVELTQDLSQAPSAEHPFGTDSAGHDLLARVLRGTQRSLEVGLTVALVATLVGTLVGAVAGYYLGWVDALLMRLVDVVLTLPAIAVAAFLGFQVADSAQGWLYLALVFAGLSWAGVARVVRGVTLTVREQPYVEAARALGATGRHILLRHVVPNAAPTIIVNATVVVAYAILAETALSFVGFGLRAPDVSLGSLVSDGQAAARTRPWLFWFPGLVIVVIALTINFIGEGLRQALEPGRAQRRFLGLRGRGRRRTPS